ncbi:hypothetical protein TNCV_1048551 [Trichonephila clavipes]|nr:hypothetical protein TNCV_1048551 [Trichonephila clavipes]
MERQLKKCLVFSCVSGQCLHSTYDLEPSGRIFMPLKCFALSLVIALGIIEGSQSPERSSKHFWNPFLSMSFNSACDDLLTSSADWFSFNMRGTSGITENIRTPLQTRVLGSKSKYVLLLQSRFGPSRVPGPPQCGG